MYKRTDGLIGVGKVSTSRWSTKRGVAATGKLATLLIPVAIATGISSPAAFADSTTTTSTQSGTVSTTGNGSGTFAVAQAVLESQLGDRIQLLGQLSSEIENHPSLSPQDRSTLLSTVQSDTTAIQGLQRTVQGDTTGSQLSSARQAMYQDYRIYAVFSPQVHLTIACDRVSSTTAGLAGFGQTLAATLTSLGNQGVNVNQAESYLSQFQTSVAASSAATAGLSSNLLSITPIDYPSSTSTFKAALNSIRSAESDLTSARQDLVAIVKSLNSSRPTVPGSTSNSGVSAPTTSTTA